MNAEHIISRTDEARRLIVENAISADDLRSVLECDSNGAVTLKRTDASYAHPVCYEVIRTADNACLFFTTDYTALRDFVYAWRAATEIALHMIDPS